MYMWVTVNARSAEHFIHMFFVPFLDICRSDTKPTISVCVCVRSILGKILTQFFCIILFYFARFGFVNIRPD